MRSAPCCDGLQRASLPLRRRTLITAALSASTSPTPAPGVRHSPTGTMTATLGQEVRSSDRWQKHDSERHRVSPVAVGPCILLSRLRLGQPRTENLAGSCCHSNLLARPRTLRGGLGGRHVYILVSSRLRGMAMVSLPPELLLLVLSPDPGSRPCGQVSPAAQELRHTSTVSLASGW